MNIDQLKEALTEEYYIKSPLPKDFCTFCSHSVMIHEWSVDYITTHSSSSDTFYYIPTGIGAVRCKEFGCDCVSTHEAFNESIRAQK